MPTSSCSPCAAVTACCAAATPSTPSPATATPYVVRRALEGRRAVLAVNLGRSPVDVDIDGRARWTVAFDTSDERWGGDGRGLELASDRLTVAGITAALLVAG